MEVINPQFKEIERKVDDLSNIVAHMRGEIDVIKVTSRDNSRQTIWQFIIFTVTMAGVMFAGLKYQADVLRREMDIRFQAVEQRILQSEKNVISRFEDLKQEVRAKR